MYKEDQFMSEALDENGLQEQDKIIVIPASGKSYSFLLNRTSIDFITECLSNEVQSPVIKKIVGRKNEKIHLRLKKVFTETNIGKHNERYLIEVIKGPALKLNGHYVFNAIIERGDEVEVSFNKIKFQLAPHQNKKCHFQKYEQAFKSKLPILLHGETGTGKTTLAKEIHEISEREGEFVAINISAFSKNIVESELFGHIKGAFTGAFQDKKGVLRQAHGGTLFLDEIDSLPLELQTKLLTFLDDMKVRSVGGQHSHQVDTRIIMATGRSLLSLISKKELRKDFYFRVTCGPTLKLPSLRDDPELIHDFCKDYEFKNKVFIAPKLLGFYQTLPWPGNYRQLKSHLDQKKVFARGPKLKFDQRDELLIEQSSHLVDIHEDFVSLKEMKSLYAKKVFYSYEQNYTKAAGKLYNS